MADAMKAEIPEDLLEAIIGPVALAAVLVQIEWIVSEVGPIRGEDFEGLARWPEDYRTGSLKDLRKCAEKIQSWTNGVLDAIAEVETRD